MVVAGRMAADPGDSRTEAAGADERLADGRLGDLTGDGDQQG